MHAGAATCFNYAFNLSINHQLCLYDILQSTGSYNETSRVAPNNVNQTSNPSAAGKAKPLEEEFPVLGNASSASQTNNQVNNTAAAQWRIKERSKEEPKTPNQQLSDNCECFK